MRTLKPAKAIVDGFRRSSLGRALLPMGTAIGLPLPYISNARAYMIVPLIERSTVNSSDDELRLPVKKPVGELRFDLLNGRLVKYHLYACDDPMPEVTDSVVYAWFPPRAVISAKWTQDQYQMQLDKLYSLLNKAVPALLKRDLNSEDIRHFLEQFRRLLPSGLERFYPRVLGSDSILLSANKTGDEASSRTTPFD